MHVMEIVVLVGLIAVVWYLATRDGDGDSASRIDTTTYHDAARPPGRRTTTDSRGGGARGVDSPFAQQIQSAIDAGRDIRFRYADVKGSVTHRTIRPHRFVEFEFTHGEGLSLCVEGHCRLRNATRNFALRRMSELEVL
jgi:predicted DNA-binding transcriptional regulator YafY